MNNSLAERIKIARVSVKLSQKQLADKLGLSEKTISAYEKERAIPPVPTLEKIANITDQPIQFFVDNGKRDPLEEISSKLDIIIKELKTIEKR
jgi:transcriptional regulator with XRE-family HTH domain